MCNLESDLFIFFEIDAWECQRETTVSVLSFFVMVREVLFAKASDFYDWDQWKCRKDQLSYDYLSDLEKGLA